VAEFPRECSATKTLGEHLTLRGSAVGGGALGGGGRGAGNASSRVDESPCSGQVKCDVLALLVQRYLLYWYKSTNTDAGGAEQIVARGQLADVYLAKYSAESGQLAWLKRMGALIEP
jgi:hypothetical protein